MGLLESLSAAGTGIMDNVVNPLLDVGGSILEGAGDVIGLDGKFGYNGGTQGLAANQSFSGIGDSVSSLFGSEDIGDSPLIDYGNTERTYDAKSGQWVGGTQVSTPGIFDKAGGYTNSAMEYLNKNKDGLAAVGGLAGKYMQYNAQKDAQKTLEDQLAYNRNKDAQADRKRSLANNYFTGGF